MILSYIRVCRPKHWIKNGFVIAPLIFSLNFNQESFVQCLVAVIAFCCASSFVYVLNDLVDRNRDRMHPEKRNRPIAAGAISITGAIFICGLLAAIITIICIRLGIQEIVVIVSYIILNLAYSFILKHIILLDVMAIALGFILRIVAGAFAVEVEVSHWMVLCTFFLSLFLGFSKRKKEIESLGKTEQRSVLKQYDESQLNLLISISVSLTIVTYSLYTFDNKVVEQFGSGALIYTVPIVVYGVLRYLVIVFQQNKGEDVAELVLKDIGIILTVIVFLVVIAVIAVTSSNFVL